jgi:two-component system response regulator NreC
VPIRILIADDHAVVRSGLRGLLGRNPDFEVVGEAGDGEEAIHLAREMQPDVVLLDIGMPGESGVVVAKRLKSEFPALIVVFLTVHEDEGLLQEGLLAGASGYVTKRADETEILEAIRAASRGQIYVHPSMTRTLLHLAGWVTHPQDDPTEPLTRRETDVLRLLARGNTNQQIAGLLGLSVRTVENHRANLTGKLGISSRVELVGYAEQHGLL